MENKAIYKLQDTNKIMTRLIKKVCSTKTLLNSSFNWFNKYNVNMASNTYGWVNVYVTDINNSSTTIADFSIDFYTNKLVFHSEGYADDICDYSINDSIIAGFIKENYELTNIVDDFEPSEEIKLYMEILKDKDSYIEEAVNEAEYVIDFINKRKFFIENITSK